MDVYVFGDIFLVVFFFVVGVIVLNSWIVLKNVGFNFIRIGIIDVF